MRLTRRTTTPDRRRSAAIALTGAALAAPATAQERAAAPAGTY
ncbi:hypothetical protein [Streptomyces sp. NPDC049555]